MLSSYGSTLKQDVEVEDLDDGLEGSSSGSGGKVQNQKAFSRKRGSEIYKEEEEAEKEDNGSGI